MPSLFAQVLAYQAHILVFDFIGSHDGFVLHYFLEELFRAAYESLPCCLRHSVRPFKALTHSAYYIYS